MEKKNIFNRIFPEEQTGKNALYLFLILTFYSIAVFAGILKHEMWRDELEPWLIPSFSNSLTDFFDNMKRGSNPYIWYLILYFLSKFTLNPVVVQFAHISFAIGAVYLFLRFSPFSVIQKLLFCAGYYIVYEYAIISRGYALTIFFLFLFCALYKKYYRITIPLAIVIFFLANATGGFGVIFSIALLIFLVANYYFNEMSVGKKTAPIKYTGWAVAIILFSVWVAMKSITPPPDSVYATKWVTELNWDRLIEVLCRTWSGFIPVPVLSSVEFWNTNFLNDGAATGVTKYFLIVSSLLFLAVNILIFSRKITVLLLYLAGTAGVLLLSYLDISIFRINASRYNGFLYIIFIASFWLLNYFPERKKVSIPVLSYLREKLQVGKYQSAVLTFFLAVSLFAGVIVYWKSFGAQFSAVEKTGKYIVAHNLRRFPAAGFVDYAVSPISAYTRKPFYYPDRDTTSTFPIWTTVNYTVVREQGMDRLASRISASNDTFLVVLNFDFNSTFYGNIQFDHLADFKGSVVWDENFYLYLCSKYNLAADLASNAPLTDEHINKYVELIYFLVQQNRLEECEKIIDKVKTKMDEKPVPKYHVYLGMAYQVRNMPDEAEREYKKEIALNFRKDLAYFQLGQLYYGEQKIDSAIAYWETSISLNPNIMDAYNNLAICYINFKKDANKAEEYWTKAIAQNPDYGQGYLNLLLLCQSKKDEDCLLKYLRIVLSKGVTVDRLRQHGVVISDELLKKANS